MIVYPRVRVNAPSSSESSSESKMTTNTKDTPTAAASWLTHTGLYHAAILSTAATIAAASSVQTANHDLSWANVARSPSKALVLLEETAPNLAVVATLFLPPAYALLYSAKHCI